MRKRRTALLGAAAAVLVLMTGLTGSALADPGAEAGPGETVAICRTGDGKEVEVKLGVPVKIEGEGGPTLTVTKATTATVMATAVAPGAEGSEGAPPPEGATKVERAEVGGKMEGKLEAVPALPAVGPDGKPLPAPVGPDGKPLDLANAETLHCTTTAAK
ncbi:hypothetical protein [Nonomuraea sp. NPDC050310]|uniref:hypothetical protein n=1 Tax=unclassified Nonomuraea TaxID=2593643 RepID=UPI0033FAE510